MDEPDKLAALDRPPPGDVAAAVPTPRNPKVFPAVLGTAGGASFEMGGGLSLRDLLIVQAMNGLLAGRVIEGGYSPDSIAAAAVRVADAVLTERQRSG